MPLEKMKRWVFYFENNNVMKLVSTEEEDNEVRDQIWDESCSTLYVHDEKMEMYLNKNLLKAIVREDVPEEAPLEAPQATNEVQADQGVANVG